MKRLCAALDDLVRAGKVRYIGCSNFSGWHLMKSLACSEKYGLPRYVGHQAYYSLIGRDYEWELMPLAIDQKVGTIVWSPLAMGKLTGKVRRNQPAASRLANDRKPPDRPGGPRRIPFPRRRCARVISRETGKTMPQVALNWVLRRPTVSTIIFGARNEQQFRENLGAVGWSLTPDQVARLDDASATKPLTLTGTSDRLSPSEIHSPRREQTRIAPA